SRLVFLRQVVAGMAFEAVGIGVTRWADLVQNRHDIRGVRDQPAALHMSIRLADEPGLVVPRSATALAGDPLQMAGLADIVRAEGDDLAFRPHLDAIVVAAAGRAGLAAPPAFRLGAGMRRPRHRLPGRLGLADVAFSGSPLFARRHARLLV